VTCPSRRTSGSRRTRLSSMLRVRRSPTSLPPAAHTPQAVRQHASRLRLIAYAPRHIPIAHYLALVALPPHCLKPVASAARLTPEGRLSAASDDRQPASRPHALAGAARPIGSSASASRPSDRPRADRRAPARSIATRQRPVSARRCVARPIAQSPHYRASIGRGLANAQRAPTDDPERSPRRWPNICAL
jgi:hypothetical protein